MAIVSFAIAASSGCAAPAHSDAAVDTLPTMRDVASPDVAVDAGLDGSFDAPRDGTPSMDTLVGEDVPPAIDAGFDVVGEDAAPETGMLCSAAEVIYGTPTPLDIFVMLDQSGSMSDTIAGGMSKWQAVTSAIQSFVSQPGLTDVSVGIQYFALRGSVSCGCSVSSDCVMPGDICIGGMCVLCGSASDSCVAADYARPEVAMAPLPGVASAIITSLAAHSPSTGTPTGPALQGAVDYARQWAMAHSGHTVVDLFVTDGVPSECAPQDNAGIAAIAASGYSGTPSVTTFALGVFALSDSTGPALLDTLAAAGGSGRAFNLTTAMDVQAMFLAAMNQIRFRDCRYSLAIPDAGTIDATHLNVQIPAADAGVVTIPHVLDVAHCPASGDAWYFDDNTSPTRIQLCPSTCSTLNTGAGAPSVNIVLGCPTQTLTP